MHTIRTRIFLLFTFIAAFIGKISAMEKSEERGTGILEQIAQFDTIRIAKITLRDQTKTPPEVSDPYTIDGSKLEHLEFIFKCVDSDAEDKEPNYINGVVTDTSLAVSLEKNASKIIVIFPPNAPVKKPSNNGEYADDTSKDPLKIDIVRTNTGLFLKIEGAFSIAKEKHLRNSKNLGDSTDTIKETNTAHYCKMKDVLTGIGELIVTFEEIERKMKNMLITQNTQTPGPEKKPCTKKKWQDHFTTKRIIIGGATIIGFSTLLYLGYQKLRTGNWSFR